MNHTELVARVADWLNRDDLQQTTIEQFIELVEKELNRILRVQQMVRNAYSDTSDALIALPPDFLELRHLMLQNENTPLTLASLTELDLIRKSVNDAAGQPTHFAMFSDRFEVAPTPNQSYRYEIVYYQEIPSLTTAAPTNWLSLSNPDLYLYGCLSKAAPYIGEDERSSLWVREYQNAINQLRTADEKKIQSGARKTLAFKTFGGNARPTFYRGG